MRSKDCNLNPNNMLKKDMIVFLTGSCKHGHKYCTHPACYLRETGKKQKIGYFDIETGGLNANFDYMLTYVIKTRDENEYFSGIIKQSDIQSYKLDKVLLKKLIKDLLRYDIIVTYYGTRFDIPFVRSRALSYGLDFPVFGLVKHKDVYYMVKRKMRLHRSSLDSACAFLNIKGKNHIKGNLWMKAKLGDEKTLEYVYNHNVKDVQILEKLHKRLESFVKNTTKSI